MSSILQLRNELRSKGYGASIANVECFDIDQNFFTHYLSLKEAIQLNNLVADHPVNLNDYIVDQDRLNKWYDFKTAV